MGRETGVVGKLYVNLFTVKSKVQGVYSFHQQFTPFKESDGREQRKG